MRYTPFFWFNKKEIYLDQRIQYGSDNKPFRLVGTKKHDSIKNLYVHTFKYVGELNHLLNFVVDVNDRVVNIYKERWCVKKNDYKIYWQWKE